MSNYSKHRKDDQRNHEIHLMLKTPIPLMESIKFVGIYEEEEDKAYRGNVTLKTGETEVSVSGSYEVLAQNSTHLSNYFNDFELLRVMLISWTYHLD